jgi:ATP-dependent helicase/nuclease subunit B
MPDSRENLTHKIYTIPAGISFADALAAGLIARAKGDPAALSRMTVLLPNRRAGRALAEAFLRQAGGSAGISGGGLLLPRMQPIGEPDEESLAITDTGFAGEAAADLAPAISDLRRRMLLAQLIHRSPQAWLGMAPQPGEASAEVTPGSPMPFDQALRLAAELARLIDQVATERLDFARVRDLAPADSEYWQLTVRFLDLVQENWPGILGDEGALDPADRRNRLIDRQRELWMRQPPPGPVIAAGSTGSIPASADLIALVARLPQGLVVLPGLDRHADVQAWAAIKGDQGHPQHGLARLLEKLGVTPSEVAVWPGPRLSEDLHRRARVVANALLPASETEHWHELAKAMAAEPASKVASIWKGVSRIDCQSEQEEAGVIALILRQAVERPAPERAALVTPDRGLARRVKAELARWGIAIDDSAGEPLRMTPPAAFFLLIAEAADAEWAPTPLLALLKHPLAAGGRSPSGFRGAVRGLERAALRGPRPAPGLEGLAAAIETAIAAAHGEAARAALRRAGGFLESLRKLAAEFAGLDGKRPLAEWLEAHLRLAEALAASDIESGAARLWREEAGEALADFVHELMEASRGMPSLSLADYTSLLPELMEGIAVRPRYGAHPRLFIWGPLEARLQQAELVVLGGLNEGVWPPEPAVDPWLSRPMREEFGLPAPERRIGLSAHDFQQAMGAREVVLTRATRAAGQPTIPSRWLLRLDAFLSQLQLGYDTAMASRWRGLQRKLDSADAVRPIRRPAPRPGAKHRPKALSVTRIETWMRDPYAIYARYILKLKPLDPLDQDPDLADLGSIIHGALDRFVATYPRELPEDAQEKLLAIGREEFAGFESKPGVMAFWWPRFQRIAGWFIDTERGRRPALAASYTEREGKAIVDAVDPPFTVTARADRIDRMKTGGLTLIDYKTGLAPKDWEVALGLSPQLSLEAAIARTGGFKDVPGTQIAALEYWRLTGASTPGEIKPVKEPGQRNGAVADANRLADEAWQGLIDLLRGFADDDAAYPSEPRAEFAPRYSDYRHLARVKEWSTSEEGGDG